MLKSCTCKEFACGCKMQSQCGDLILQEDVMLQYTGAQHTSCAVPRKILSKERCHQSSDLADSAPAGQHDNVACNLKSNNQLHSNLQSSQPGTKPSAAAAENKPTLHSTCENVQGKLEMSPAARLGASASCSRAALRASRPCPDVAHVSTQAEKECWQLSGIPRAADNDPDCSSF